MDRASDYGSEGWGFDSLPARFRRSAAVIAGRRCWQGRTALASCSELRLPFSPRSSVQSPLPDATFRCPRELAIRCDHTGPERRWCAGLRCVLRQGVHAATAAHVRDDGELGGGGGTGAGGDDSGSRTLGPGEPHDLASWLCIPDSGEPEPKSAPTVGAPRSLGPRARALIGRRARGDRFSGCGSHDAPTWPAGGHPPGRVAGARRPRGRTDPGISPSSVRSRVHRAKAFLAGGVGEADV